MTLPSYEEGPEDNKQQAFSEGVAIYTTKYFR